MSVHNLYTNSSPEANASCNPFDSREYAIVAGVAAVSGFISFIASCFIIFIIILFKKWRFFIQKLILYLAAAVAINSLSILTQRVDYENQTSPSYVHFCAIAGFFNQTTSWMFLNAIISITVSMFIATIFNKEPEKFGVGFAIFIFIIPLTFNWIPFIKSAYGKSGAWCWIRSQDLDTCEAFPFGQALEIGLWYAPLYFTLCMLIILYVIILVKLRYTKKKWAGKFDPQADKIKEKMSNEILPLIAYPMIFFIFSIPPLINRIYDQVNHSEPQLGLWFLSAVVCPLQGGIIAVAYSLDPETRKRLTMANFRAALSDFTESKKIREYPVKDEMENSVRKEDIKYHQAA